MGCLYWSYKGGAWPTKLASLRGTAAKECVYHTWQPKECKTPLWAQPSIKVWWVTNALALKIAPVMLRETQ